MATGNQLIVPEIEELVKAFETNPANALTIREKKKITKPTKATPKQGGKVVKKNPNEYLNVFFNINGKEIPAFVMLRDINVSLKEIESMDEEVGKRHQASAQMGNLPELVQKFYRLADAEYTRQMEKYKEENPRFKTKTVLPMFQKTLGASSEAKDDNGKSLAGTELEPEKQVIRWKLNFDSVYSDNDPVGALRGKPRTEFRDSKSGKEITTPDGKTIMQYPVAKTQKGDKITDSNVLEFARRAHVDKARADYRSVIISAFGISWGGSIQVAQLGNTEDAAYEDPEFGDAYDESATQSASAASAASTTPAAAAATPDVKQEAAPARNGSSAKPHNPPQEPKNNNVEGSNSDVDAFLNS